MKVEKLLTPVNKTAAGVVSQERCSEKYTDEQRRENLKAHMKRLLEELETLPRKSLRRRNLGQQIQVVQLEMCAIRKSKGPKLEQYIINIIKEDFTPFQWETLVKKARARYNAAWSK